MPFLAIFFLNWSVYKAAKVQANQVAIQFGSFAGSENQQQETSRRQMSERKAAIDVSLMIAAFLVFFLPTWVVGLCRRFFKSIKVAAEVELITSCVFTASSVLYATQSSTASAKETFEPWLRMC